MNKHTKQVEKQLKRHLSKSPLWVTVLVLLIAGGFYIFNSYFNKPEIPEGQLQVHFIDVGQGDCQLLSAEDCTVLIDSGTSDSKYELSSYLSRHVTEIDYLILTHPHEDHIGGAAQVIADFPVKNVIMPDAVSDSAVFEKLLSAMEEKNISGILAEAGSEYTVGELEMTILAPLSEEYDNTNNYSIILRADYGEDSFMFTGDAETLAEKEVLAEYPASVLDCDVLKVGHHGSDTSSSADFLAAVTPNIAVIGVGEGNSYGHPSSKVLSRLEKYCSQILRTDKDGTVVLLSEGTGVTVAD